MRKEYDFVFLNRVLRKLRRTRYVIEVELFMYEDEFWTCGSVWTDASVDKMVKWQRVGGIVSSHWATPYARVYFACGYIEFPCYKCLQ